MVNKFEIDIIIERAKEAFKVRNQEELANIFGISPSDFSKRKRTGSLTKLIEKEAYKRKISYDWIITGQGHRTFGHGTGTYVGEPQAPYNGADSDHHIPAQSKPLLELTADVLSTDSVYRDALTSNVKAFHDAVSARKQLAVAEAKLAQCQRENIELKQELNERDSIIEKLQAVISELRAAKSGTGGA